MDCFDEARNPGLIAKRLAEFEKRRGYDLRRHLAALVSGTDAQAIAVRQDWGLTLSELYEERFLRQASKLYRAE